MNWFFQNLGVPGPIFSEPKVECRSCKILPPLKRMGHYSPDTKCCQFSPFWSAFGVGAWLEQGAEPGALEKLWGKGFLFTKLGILHPLEHRQDQKALCQHFQPGGGCGIWHQRPPICFGFFCASGHKDGLLMYGRLEQWLLKNEAALLRLWFEQQRLPEALWEAWGEYMEVDPKIKGLPEPLKVYDLDEAQELYTRAFISLKKTPYARVLSKMQNEWERGLGREPVLS